MPLLPLQSTAMRRQKWQKCTRSTMLLRSLLRRSVSALPREASLTGQHQLLVVPPRSRLLLLKQLRLTHSSPLMQQLWS